MSMSHSLSSTYSVSLNLSSFLKPHHKRASITKSFDPVRCGPRDNRGPLVKGRILSTEAIQAIQSLKRAHRSDRHNLPSLSRLIKSDLLAVLRDLLRQDQCTLALHVLSTVRSEYPPVDLNLHAEIVNALARNGESNEIDRLIEGLAGIDGCDDDKGLVKLLRGVFGAGRRESMVGIYRMMKEGGWGSATWQADERVVEVLSKGLRRFGERALAEEIEMKISGIRRGSFGKEKNEALK